MAPYSGLFMTIDKSTVVALAAKAGPRSMQPPVVIEGDSSLQRALYVPLVIHFVKVISKAYYSVMVLYLTIEIYLFHCMKQLWSPVPLFVSSPSPPDMTRDH